MIGNSGSKYDFGGDLDNDVASRNLTIKLYEDNIKRAVMADMSYFDGKQISPAQRVQCLLRVAKWYQDMSE